MTATATRTRPNTYAGTCARCGGNVAAKAGLLGAKVDGRWTVTHAECPATTPDYLTVEGNTVTITRRPSAAPASQMCDECDERPARYTARDMSGIAGRVCGRCYGTGHLSFA